MQEEFHKRFDLRSRKISQTQDRNEEPAQPATPKQNDNGKRPVRSDPKTKGETSRPTHSKSEFANTKEIPVQTKLVHQENKESIKPLKVEMNASTFSLQKGLDKVNIYVPLTEFLKQPAYKIHIFDFMDVSHVTSTQDILNLWEDRLVVMFGLCMEEQDPSTPPFYVTLVIHDLLLHNSMIDSGTSHNLMPLYVME